MREFRDIAPILSHIFESHIQESDDDRIAVDTQEGLFLQFEHNPKEDGFDIACPLGDLPLGAFRNRIFERALQTNGLLPPHYGILAAHNSSSAFLLYETLRYNDFDEKSLRIFLEFFIKKAVLWKKALSTGDLPK